MIAGAASTVPPSFVFGSLDMPLPLPRPLPLPLPLLLALGARPRLVSCVDPPMLLDPSDRKSLAEVLGLPWLPPLPLEPLPLIPRLLLPLGLPLVPLAPDLERDRERFLGARSAAASCLSFS